MCSYYMFFVKGFSYLGAFLTDLPMKWEFRWTKEAQQEFDKTKEAMRTCSVLALPDFTQPFVLECDASSEGKRAALMQNKHLITFES